MSQNNKSESSSSTPSFGAKVGYIGTGIVIGLVVYPFVRKAIAKIQPKLDQVLDEMTGRAEDLAERTSDLFARARETLRKSDGESERGARTKTKKRQAA